MYIYISQKMGGSAIKKVKVTRFTNSKYQSISSKIISDLSESGIEASVAHCVPGKETHGDLDILIQDKSDTDILDFIIRKYKPVEYYDNNVISFAYTEGEIDVDGELIYYQVDFQPCKNLQAAVFFFSYGDIGAIIGKYLGHHGITFSDEGISIKVGSKILGIEHKDPHYIYGMVHITSDPIEICKIIGTDYNKWLTLSSIDEIFDWVLSSKYYTLDAFKFIPMDKAKRILVRPLYTNFMKHIGIEDFRNISKKIINPQLLSTQFSILEEYNKGKELDEIRAKVYLERERKDKFNVSFFIENGVNTHELRNVMGDFKRFIVNGECAHFDNWIDGKTKEEIGELVKLYVKTEYSV